jgi:hypothetical protein
VRHIPDEELHAYLDQALSRSQCVEIETHLAACLRCRRERDAIAALRDRTTMLLGLVAPALHRRPSYAELLLAARSRQAEALAAGDTGRSAVMARWTRHGLRAAGFLVAIAAGWSARGLLPGSSPAGDESLPALATTAGPPALGPFAWRGPETLSPPTPPPVETATTSQPDPAWTPDPVERRVSRPAARSVTPPLAVTVNAGEISDGSAEFVAAGVWRTVSFAEVAALTGDAVPRIMGLPVLEFQIQSLGPLERPMVMVTHLDSSGRLIRTIEGPAELVADLLSAEIERSHGAVRTSRPVRSAPDYSGTSRTSRVYSVAGRAEAETLEVLARQVTLR